MTREQRTLILQALSILIIGAIAGWALRSAGIFRSLPAKRPASVQVRADLPQYKLINPLLYSDGPEDTSDFSNALQSAFSAQISAAESGGDAQSVSVYFRDMNSGRWSGVDEDGAYKPSSMLKVIDLMAVLEVAEDQPGFLSKKLPYIGTDHSDQYFKPADDMPSGSYTVNQLANAMIIDSDNDALSALTADPDISRQFNDIYSLFRLPEDATDSPDYMSPKSYSVIFRTLYNSTVFSWNVSEEALELLSNTAFSGGLVAGVPPGIDVAHKFGENTGTLPDGTVVNRELHDCGIIYYPNDPYLLCVMTRGSDFDKLETVISGISATAYNLVNTQNK